MRELNDYDGLGAADIKFLQIIQKYGWHVMSVVPRTDSDDKEEWFSYSTGLFLKFGHPEIILCGLPSDTALAIINEVGSGIQSGRKFCLDEDYADIFANDVKCRFREVHVSRYHEYVCLSQWFYENNEFPVWQCFWPDKGGRYPWESDCDPVVAELQPKLYEPATLAP